MTKPKPDCSQGGKRQTVRKGERYGSMTALSNPDAEGLVKCVCVCGRQEEVASRRLMSYKSPGCNCKRKDSLRRIATTHGLSGTRTYRIWKDVVRRALGRKSRDLYAERGITICERWRSYENFLHDMGECPPGLSIDRIDNDGSYEPGNCRWATAKEQNRNKRSTIIVNYKGQDIPLRELAERQNISARALRYRIVELGWSAEKAVETPNRFRSRPLAPYSTR